MKKRFTEEQIIGILREGERPGTDVRTVVRRHNVTEQTFYQWRNKYGCMDVPDCPQAHPPLSTNCTRGALA